MTSLVTRRGGQGSLVNIHTATGNARRLKKNALTTARLSMGGSALVREVQIKVGGRGWARLCQTAQRPEWVHRFTNQ